MKHFKAPYALLLALMAVAAGVFIIFATPLHETAFAYGSGLVGGFLVCGAIAAGYHAYRSALALGVLALLMMSVIAIGVDAEAFKDIAMKGLASGAAAGVVVIIKTLLDRFKEMDQPA